MKFIFRKISNNHSRLRDDEVECFHCSTIVVGAPVVLMAPSRDIAGGQRIIQTSPLTKAEKTDKIWKIETQSGSKYEIEEY